MEENLSSLTSPPLHINERLKKTISYCLLEYTRLITIYSKSQSLISTKEITNEAQGQEKPRFVLSYH